MASVGFGINWALTRGFSGMFDGTSELILAVGYFFALIFSIFIHIKVKNKGITKVYKTFIGISYLNLIAIIFSVILSLTCEGSSCMVVIFPISAVALLWFISLVLGSISLRNTNLNYLNNN